jgi:hypothetical protein
MKRLIIQLCLILLAALKTHSQNRPLNHFEGSYLFQGVYPSGLHNKDWFPDDYEVQGVTNDGKNWFFTSIDRDNDMPVIWKIPQGVPLDGDVSGKPGVRKKNYSDSDLSELRDLSAYHWGDPDHFEYEGVDYILVPIQRKDERPIIACFRADNLQFINYGWLPTTVYPGWCAIGIDRALYTSANDIGWIIRFEVVWEKLLFQQEHDCFSFSEAIPLTNPDGSEVVMTDLQGGEFSSSGEMLYLVSGRCSCAGNGAAWSERDGIHAIETNSWTRLDQSLKNSEPINHFSYDYDAGCTWCTVLFPPFRVPVGCHTPEGITFWDLEDESAPGITGSLHVLVDYYTGWEPGPTGCDEDKLYFYHYSANVHVDKDARGGPGLLGIPGNPFNTVNDAYDYYPIWNGARMVIKAGVYDDTGVFSTRIMMTSQGGAAIIGKQ